jgi:hypothetical protein
VRCKKWTEEALPACRSLRETKVRAMAKREVDFDKLASDLSDGELTKFIDTVREHLTPDMLETTRSQERIVACTPNYCVVVRPEEKKV